MAVSAYLPDALELARAELHVPPPQRDHFGYTVPRIELSDAPDGVPAPILKAIGWDDDPPVIVPSGVILDQFIRLAEVPEPEFPPKVLAFAQRYGMLAICRHGKPRNHVADCGTALGGLGEKIPFGWPFWEPLEPWRRYSRQLRAILSLAVDLQNDEFGSEEDWQAVRDGDPSGPVVPLDDYYDELRLKEADFTILRFGEPQDPEGKRIARQGRLASVVDIWLRYGSVHPVIEWNPDQPTMTMRMASDGLTGALAVQLAAALAGPLYRCSGCGNPFQPETEKRPAITKRKWCASCGRLAQWRDYQKRRYQKKKQQEQDNGEA